MSVHRLIRLSELPKGAIRAFVVDDDPVLVARTADDGLYATEDCCSHDGGTFEHGALDGTVLTCPRHGATFDVTTGRALTMPAVAPIETYPLSVTDDGWVAVELEEDE